jgi:enoyl-CoA hydratase/carnithine racemase
LIANDEINANFLPQAILQAPWIAAIAGAAFVAGLGTLLAARKKAGA